MRSAPRAWIRAQAIAHACSLRFRPIMMTTCAAIAGALPLALAYGDGTEMRRPLGISIVGGLIVSQLLTRLHHAGGVPVRASLLEARARLARASRRRRRRETRRLRLRAGERT